MAPAEVEQCLEGHPAVKLAQVVPIPDDRLLEVPVAFVELQDGASATEQEIIAHCKGRIASYKVPRLVRFIEAWPMSATKIQRKELKKMIEAELAGQKARA